MKLNTASRARSLVILLAIIFVVAGATTSCKSAAPNVDTTPPTVTATSTTADPTGTSPIDVTIVFSEVVTGFDETDLTIGNATVDVGSFSTANSKTFTVNLTPDGSEVTVTLDIAADVCTDGAENPNTALGTTFNRFYTARPAPSITSGTADPTNADPIPITIDFGEAVENFDDTDFTLTNCTVSVPSSGDGGITWTANLTPAGQGLVEATIPEGVCDEAGVSTITNVASATFSRTFDSIAPDVTISATTTQLRTNTNPIPITITFTESVSGFDETDLTVVNGTVGTVAGGPSVYTCDITPTTAGTATTIDIAAGACQDEAGNGNTVATQFTRTYITSLGVGPTPGVANALGGGTTDTVTTSITLDSSKINHVLIAQVCAESNSATVPSITGVTYHSVAMTLVPGSTISYTNGTNQHMVAALYYLKDPDLGGYYEVTATFNSKTFFMQIGALELQDAYVHGGHDPIGVVAKKDGGASTSVTTNITTGTAYSMLVDVVCTDTDPGNPPDIDVSQPGQTRQWRQAPNNGGSGGSTKTVAAAGASSMGWTVTASSTYALLHSVAEIKIAH